MKKFSAIILFIAISTFVLAQDTYQDIIYLRNGSIVRGTIIEQIPGKSVKIETTDKDVFVYQMNEIDHMEKIKIQGTVQKKSKNTGLMRGYSGIVETGVGFVEGTYTDDILFKLNIINGYRVSPYFSFGFGTGLRGFLDEESLLIPVFIDSRVNVINRRVSPYVSLDVGYSFDIIDEEPAGLLLNLTTGVSFKIAKRSAVNIGIGYERQYVTVYGYSYYFGFYSFAGYIHGLSINTSITF